MSSSWWGGIFQHPGWVDPKIDHRWWCHGIPSINPGNVIPNNIFREKSTSWRWCQLQRYVVWNFHPENLGEDEDSQFWRTAHIFSDGFFNSNVPEVWLNHRSGQVWKGAWKGGQWFEQRSWGMAFIGDVFPAPAIFQPLNTIEILVSG